MAATRCWARTGRSGERRALVVRRTGRAWVHRALGPRGGRRVVKRRTPGCGPGGGACIDCGDTTDREAMPLYSITDFERAVARCPPSSTGSPRLRECGRPDWAGMFVCGGSAAQQGMLPGRGGAGSGITGQLTLRAGRIRDRAEPSAAGVGPRAAPATDSEMWERANEEIRNG